MNKRKLLPLIFAISAILVSCNSEGEKRTITFENIGITKDYAQSSTFQGVGRNNEIEPGQEIQISFNAQKGQSLMFATMYANSWDLFFAPDNPGIKLFDNNGNPMTGDVSDQVKLWDAGTKKNIDPRRPKASQPKENEDGKVSEISGKDGKYNYPKASEMMKLSLSYDAAASRFTLTMHNNTNNTNVQTLFSTGVWAVSNAIDGKPVNDKPFFNPGDKAGMELVPLAEDGKNKPLGDKLAANTGVYAELSPVVIAIYTGDQNPLLASGGNEMNNDLHQWAQSDDTDNLKKSLESNSNVKSVHVISSATKPGDKADASYNARRGEKIAFAMRIGNQSFIGNSASIDALEMKDITGDVKLYDNNAGQMPAVNQLVRISINK